MSMTVRCSVVVSVLALAIAGPVFGRETSPAAKSSSARLSPAASAPTEQRPAPSVGYSDWLSALVNAANTTCKSGDGDFCSCNGGGCYATATVCRCL
jgi:hypothetical protein